MSSHALEPLALVTNLGTSHHQQGRPVASVRVGFILLCKDKCRSREAHIPSPSGISQSRPFGCLPQILREQLDCSLPELSQD